MSDVAALAYCLVWAIAFVMVLLSIFFEEERWWWPKKWRRYS